MAFENEEGDLKKLNIIVQFVFLSLNSLYVVPLLLTFNQNFIVLFLAHPMVQKIVEIDQNLSKLCPLKVKKVICKN
jgi:hypothetical protein